MNDQGTSMYELLIVMGIMGLVLAAGMPSLRAAAKDRQERAVVTELTAELRAARYLAIARREPVRLRWESGRGRLLVEAVHSNAKPLRQFDYGRTGLEVEDADAARAVWFYPSGRTATPRSIVIRTREGRAWRLTVSLLGRVSVEELAREGLS